MKFDAKIKQLSHTYKNSPEAKQAIRDTLHLVECHLYDILKQHRKQAQPLPSAQHEAGA